MCGQHIHGNKTRVITTGFHAVLFCALPVAALASTAAAGDGFRPIFDGKTLQGWTGEAGYWRVEDGHIVGEWTEGNQPKENTFLIWEGGQPADFEVRFRFKFDSPRGNSGIQIRSERLHGHVVRGYQPDIATDGWITGVAYEERGRAQLARRGQRTVIDKDGNRKTERFADEDELGKLFDPHQWTEYHVIAVGNRISIKINGHLMSEIVDDAPEARRRGVLAFQLHRGTPMKLRFADVELKLHGNPATARVSGRDGGATDRRGFE